MAEMKAAGGLLGKARANRRGQFFILAAVMVGLLIYTTRPSGSAITVKEGEPLDEFVGNAMGEYMRVVGYSLAGPELVKSNLYSFSDFLANRSRDKFWAYRSFYVVDYTAERNSTLIYGNFLGGNSGVYVNGAYVPVNDLSTGESVLPRAPVAVSYEGNEFVFYPNRTVSAYFYLEVCSGDYCQIRERLV